jgi:Glycosyl hydrolase family 26
METLRDPNQKRFGPAQLGGLMSALLATLLAWLLMPLGVAQAAPVALGSYIPHADESPGLIDSFTHQVGWSPVILTSFKTFDQAPVYFPQLNGAREHGAVPMVTWEPQTSSEGRIDLSRIASGDYDGYVGDAARAAAAWGKPMMIRFGQEMNGSWYPWSPASGNSAHSFVSAWRHLVRIFRREGAGNVRWVWTPYVKTPNNLPFKRFYPGDRYVDWAGLDGYNWGGKFEWKSFHELFAHSYRKLAHLTSRPLMIGEVGCGEVGGNKARWLRLMLRRDVPQMPDFRAVVWFDQIDEKGDLRVDTSHAALASFRRWTNQPLFRSSREALLRTPRRLQGGR